MERLLLEAIWWVLLPVVFYVYFGYPTLLWVLSRLKGRRPVPIRDDFEPKVSLIIAAYNEERVIDQKLENSLSLDYPRNKLEIIVVSDGSTDRTSDIVRGYSVQGIQLVELAHNVGKASAQNEAVKQAKGDILLFTDAEILLQQDVIHKMIQHFHDGTVGCVVGKVTYLNEGETAVSEGEGLYWRYELSLRRKESEVGNLAMGSGSIIAVRRSLFEPIDPAVSEDFVLPMGAAIQGYRTLYESEAIARLKLFQVRAHEMFNTKVRTVTLDTRSLFLCRAILNPFQYPLYAWGLISHKLLRWLVPYFLIVLLAINLLLLGYAFYNLTLAVQILFYSLAVIGYLRQQRHKLPGIVRSPFFFCLINLAALVGVAQFVMGRKAGRWRPVRGYSKQLHK